MLVELPRRDFNARVVALCGHPRMSAFWSLSGVKQTLPGPAKIDANDPSQTFGESAFVDLVAAERLGVAFKAEARTEGVAMARP